LGPLGKQPPHYNRDVGHPSTTTPPPLGISGISRVEPAAVRPEREHEAAFTIDVEDWYQSCVDYDAPITEQVVRNVHRVFEVLDAHAVKGTFFVQGRVAERFPALVQEIRRLGHEVQSHGYSHRPLSAMNSRQLRDEIDRARKTVEDAAGSPVNAFRAQDFSIGQDNLWALETLAEVGFTIDSSIFPMHLPRYGIAGWRLEPHRVHLSREVSLLEVPVAIWRLGRWRVPVAGGGYFRLLPEALLVKALQSICSEGRPPVIYCHPYEFNPTELAAYRGRLSPALRLSQSAGRSSFASRVHALLTRFRFGRFDAVLDSWGLV
jgi:polysaccharide deacetylase family protein (PEP-CTERM system associated)